MPSRPSNIKVHQPDEINDIVGALNDALERIDLLGLSDTGALLARVLDSLGSLVSDATDNAPAIQS
jgi:hypothetical protein